MTEYRRAVEYTVDVIIKVYKDKATAKDILIMPETVLLAHMYESSIDWIVEDILKVYQGRFK